MGRPTRCTPALTQRIADRHANGLGILQSLTFGPICETTHYNWVERGQAALDLDNAGEPVPESEQPFMGYVRAIRKAADEFEDYHLKLIQDAAAGRPSVTVTTTTTRKPVTLKNGEMARDPDTGEILFVEETSTRTAESATYSWQASAWLLERTRRERYSRTVNQVHTGPDGGPVATTDAGREEALLAEIDRLAERLVTDTNAPVDDGAVSP